MRNHLLKLFAFALLQLLLLVMVQRLAYTPPPPDFAALAPAEKLHSQLREQLYTEWLLDRHLLAHIGAQEKPSPQIQAAFNAVRANDDYVHAIIDKDQRLRTCTGRRMVMLGGSNLAFGMDSQLFAERYDVVPINLGLLAALQNKFVLRHTLDNIRAGDVAIFCFEYHVMMNPILEPNPDLKKLVCDAYPAIRSIFDDEVNDIVPWDWKNYSDRVALADFSAHVNNTNGKAWRRLSNLCPDLCWAEPEEQDHNRVHYEAEFVAVWPTLQRQYLNTYGAYSRSSFNEYGDVVSHFSMTSNNPLKPLYQGEIEGPRREGMLKNIQLLNDFVAQYRARGATIYFAYPPLLEADPIFAAQYEAIVKEHCTAPVLFPIQEASTRTEEHYDSNYHLNWRGVCRRMKTWSTALDQHLEARVSMTPAQHVEQRDRAMHGEQNLPVRLVNYEE